MTRRNMRGRLHAGGCQKSAETPPKPAPRVLSMQLLLVYLPLNEGVMRRAGASGVLARGRQLRHYCH